MLLRFGPVRSTFYTLFCLWFPLASLSSNLEAKGLEAKHNAGSKTSLLNSSEKSVKKKKKRKRRKKFTSASRRKNHDLDTYLKDVNERWSLEYLTLLGAPMDELDDQGAQKLAEIARDEAPYRRSHGSCMRWVRKALQKWLIVYHKSPAPDLNQLEADDKSKTATRKIGTPGKSGEDFSKWARANPQTLCQELGLANVDTTKIDPIRDGNILVYRKGRCGFNPRYGHIEIVTDEKNSIVCSDHCRTRTNNTCEPDLVLAPVKSCEWLNSPSSEVRIGPREKMVNTATTRTGTGSKLIEQENS